MAELKPGWQRWRFAQIAANINERVDNPSEAGVDRYVGLEHLDADSLKIRRWGSPDDVGATKLRFYPGDIIFGRRRAYQRKLGVADFEGICSAHAMVLRAKPDVILPEFLPFFMQSDLFMERAQEISVGSLSPTINWKTLAAQEFALPPLEEQRRLAAVLGGVRKLQESLIETGAKLVTLRDSIIKSRSSELVNRFGLRPFGSIVSSIQSGKSPKARNDSASDNEYGVLKVSAVGDWMFHQNENKAINHATFMPDLEVKAGDVLATRANADPGSVGRTCIVDRTRPGLMLSDKTWRLQFASSDYSKIGIVAWTKSPVFRKYVHANIGGTEAKNISQALFLNAPFPDCTAAEFNAFAREVEVITNSAHIITARLTQSKNMRLVSLDGDGKF